MNPLLARSLTLAACFGVTATVFLSLPGAASAERRVFHGKGAGRYSVVFSVRGVDAQGLSRARVRIRGYSRRVRLSGLRRALRRSRVRIHVPWRVARRAKRVLRHGTRAQRRAVRLIVVSARERAPARAGSWTRMSSFESSLNEAVDYGWNVPAPVSVERTSERGGAGDRFAAKIVTNGGNAGCSCPRMTYDKLPNGKPGDDIWIGASYLIPDPSKLTWSRMFNLAHYVSGDTNWYLGLTTRGDAGNMHLAFAPYHGSETDIVPAQPIPANRWFDVDVHLKLSPTDGQALTQLFVDGKKVAESTTANMLNSSPLTFYNGGLTYSNQGVDTTVYFDRPRVR